MMVDQPDSPGDDPGGAEAIYPEVVAHLGGLVCPCGGAGYQLPDCTRVSAFWTSVPELRPGVSLSRRSGPGHSSDGRGCASGPRSDSGRWLATSGLCRSGSTS